MTTTPPPVRIIRSTRRTKTVSARLDGGVITVRAPATLSEHELGEHVDRLVERLCRRRAADRIDLTERAERIAAAHDLPRPTSIRFVSNQDHRWGSCTPAAGTIRISDRLADAPGWVIDHIVLHELAHLAEPDHGAGFRAIVERSPDHDRAEGFLLGLSHARQSAGPATPAPDDPAG